MNDILNNMSNENMRHTGNEIDRRTDAVVMNPELFLEDVHSL